LTYARGGEEGEDRNRDKRDIAPKALHEDKMKWGVVPKRGKRMDGRARLPPAGGDATGRRKNNAK